MGLERFTGLFSSSTPANASSNETGRASMAPSFVDSSPVRRSLPAAARQTAIRSLMQAAQTGRTEASWSTTPTSADTLIQQNWSPMVARSRAAAMDNDYAKKYLSMVKNNVIGAHGIRMIPQIVDPNGKSDVLANDAVASGWEDFSEEENFCVTGNMSRVEAEKQLMESAATNGEMICEFVYGPDAGPWGFAVQIIDPVLLDPNYNVVLPSGNVIRHGIEFNRFWRPVRYWFRNYMLEQVDYYERQENRYRSVEARNIVHGFVQELVGQKRGLPWMRTALWRLRMLKGFEDAALVNARIGAAKMGFFKDPDSQNDDEDEIPMDAEPGTFENIGNREFSSFNPNFPEASTEAFSREMKRGASSGLDVSYNNLASDLTSVNFSSIRQGALDEREMWKGLQEWFAKKFDKRCFRAWLEVALLSGRLTVAGKPLKYERMDKYKKVSFQGRRWAWIDPSAEIAAHEKAISLNIESRTQVIRDGGGVAYEVFKEISDEREDMKSLKLNPDVVVAGATNVQQKPADTNQP